MEVDGLIRRKIMKVALSRTTTFDRPPRTNKRKNFIPLPFFPSITSQLGEVLKTVKMSPVFYPHVTIGRLFSKGKGLTHPLARSGVYLLSCGDCPAVYIGEIRRSFATRFCDLFSKTSIMWCK